MGDLVIETKRVLIEQITIDDAPFFLELYQSPDFIRFVGQRDFFTVEHVREHMNEGMLKVFDEQGFGYYLVKNKAGQTMGTCGFMKKDYLQFFDFGFAYLPQFYRQGFGYEAALAILQYGQHNFDLTTLDAITIEENIASKSLLEKLGFVYLEDIAEPGTDTTLQLYRKSK